MISRYALYDTKQLEKRFNLADGLPKGVKPHYNVSPTMDEPVIVNRDGERVVELMKWGLVANGSKDTNSVFRYKTYNVASEKILSKHSWEIAIRKTRCLIPVNGFYVLAEGGEKRAYFVSAKDGSLLALAGLYTTWQDHLGVSRQTYSVITTDTSLEMPSINDRMPIIISQSEEPRWLDTSVTDINDLYTMFRSYLTDQLKVDEVSLSIYSTKVDSPSLTAPLHTS